MQDNKNTMWIIALVAVALVVIAIMSMNRAPMESTEPAAPDAAGLTLDELEGRSFLLASHDGMDVPDGVEYTLEFADGRLYAKFCNNMSGDPSLEGGVLSVSPLVSTLMFCMEPEGTMDAETAFGNLMEHGAAVSLAGDRLTLMGDGTEMAFAAR